jgi:hypothetical protein
VHAIHDFVTFRVARAIRWVPTLLVLTVVAGQPLRAQDTKPQKAMKDDNRVLSTTTLGGQVVIVLPMTQARVAPGIAADASQAPWRGGAATLAAADSVLTEILGQRAAAVRWVMPADTRRMAKRAGGIVPPADQMGQAVMHPQGLNNIPDPLRASLRTMSSLAGGRYALIPAMLILTKDSAGVHAIYSAAMGDPRSGLVLWHTFARGNGTTADAAVHAAFDMLLPPDPNAP